MAPRPSRDCFIAHATGREVALDGTPLATFGQRLLGYAVDLVLAVALWAPIEIGLRLLVLGEQNVHVAWDFHEPGNLLTLIAYHGMFNYFGNGRTPGKWLARTQIVSLTHDRMGRWQSIERALGYGAAVLELGLGFLQFFWSANRMCAQDRLSETIVVDRRRRDSPDQPSMKSR